MQVIAIKPSSKNLYWRAPAALACHIEGSEGSVFNTGEITLVLFGLHRVGNPKYSEDMKQLTKALLNLARTFIPRRTKPVTPRQSLHWTKFDKPVDQMTADERRAAAERLATEAFENLNKRDK